MKILKTGIVFLIFIFSRIAFGQHSTKSNTDTLFIGVSSYLHGSKFSNGTIALGPTLIMNAYKWSIQLSFLTDTRTYTTYSGVTPHSTYIAKNKLNCFIPVLFSYNYINTNKFKSFVTLGAIIGGKYYLDADNITRETNPVSAVAGVGFSYKMFKYVLSRLSFTARYSQKIVFPGLFLDLTVPIKIRYKK
jgi:hypothetical protein